MGRSVGRTRKKHHIGSELQIRYISTILVPVIILGTVLIATSFFSQRTYYGKLLSAFTARITQTVYDLTSYAYNMSQTIIENDELLDAVSSDYISQTAFRDYMNRVEIVDPAFEKYAGIEKVLIFVDYENAATGGNIVKVNDDIRNQAWYKTACSRYSSFWTSYRYTDSFDKNVTSLALVRKFPLSDSDRQAVIMIILSNTFLTSRVENAGYSVHMSVNDEPVFFSTDTEAAAVFEMLPIDYDRVSFKSEGTVKINGRNALYSVNSLKPAQSSYTQIYVAVFDSTAYRELGRNIWILVLVLLAAVILPLMLTSFNTRRFTGEIMLLRNEMHRASHDRKSGSGDAAQAKMQFDSIELSEAYEDLQIMVKDIEEMEKKEYEAELQKQKADTEQKKMEFKVLASQINPHFLYNTLEMIRMKALTNEDREVAKAIKLLGQSMRYVLEHTTSQETSLKKEYDHIMTYLQIQQLRFADRVNYQVNIEPGLDMESLQMLPLTLQPIVENAIVHGVETMEDRARVEVSLAYSDDTIVIHVKDNGIGFDVAAMDILAEKADVGAEGKVSREKLGLRNTDQRLKLMYGTEYGLIIHSEVGRGTDIEIHIPKRYMAEAVGGSDD